MNAEWRASPPCAGFYYRRYFNEKGECVGQGITDLTKADVEAHQRSPWKGTLWYGPIPVPSGLMISACIPEEKP